MKVFVPESVDNLERGKSSKEPSDRHHTDIDDIEVKHLWMFREMNIVREDIETIWEEYEPENEKYPSQNSNPLDRKSSKEIWQKGEYEVPNKSEIIRSTSDVHTND